MKTITQKILLVALSAAFTIVNTGMPLFVAHAASFTGAKDTMSTQALNTTANHVLTWTLVGGDTFAAGETFTVDFVDADFTANAIGNWQTADFTFNDGSARTVTAVSSSSGVAPVCAAGNNNVAITIDTSANNFVVTACATYSSSSANAAITLTLFGTAGTGTGTFTNKSSDVNSSVVSITESNADTASVAVVAETNAVVTVTATVNPLLTFAISANSVSLGTLSTSSTGSGSHTISAATNAGGGFLVSYTGSTLTSGLNTIDALATPTTSSQGTAQFGINLKDNATPNIGSNPTTNAGACSPASDYNTADSFTYVAGATTALTNESAPADCVFTTSYIANIATTTPAGSYSTAITYVASGTF